MTATRRAAAAQRSVRRRVGAATEVEIESALFDLKHAPPLKVDDVVIEAWAPRKGAALEDAFHPARVVEILHLTGRGRSEGWVLAYWRRPAGTGDSTRKWEEVQRAAARAGVRLADNHNIARRITSPAAHAALRSLWS